MNARQFSKVLIANRGEIACRIMRTLKRLGIRSVAVYSDADRNALHVALADEAVHIGNSPASESYLNIGRLIAAAKETNADAIHPGYGFLSENPDFAEQCEQNGIRFIGPPVEAIRVMGSKSAAKRLMETIGVPLIPGYHGDDQSEQTLLREANRIGYPVLLKAAMGGGGKGMRVAQSAAELPDAIASCRREALASFADDTLLLEKYVERPRHIEVQVFCDTLGNAVHLFERDCSIQRRHQKIIEECPAPDLPQTVLQSMYDAALTAARAIGYAGAGTVEFLYDARGDFYFMEMNTRLQVEHPVTEMITGQDLVEWQIRVAQGQPLPLTQKDIRQQGHAIEVRICAENPANDFMPSIGPFLVRSKPGLSDNIRLDSGVRDTDAISIYYDSMIAKLICWGETRENAIDRLLAALQQFCASGVETNIAYLAQLLSNPNFRQKKLATNFIAEQQDTLELSRKADTRHIVAAALFELLQPAAGSDQSEWTANAHWRLNTRNTSDHRFLIGDRVIIATVIRLGSSFTVQVEDETFKLEARAVNHSLQVSGDIRGTFQLFADEDAVYLFDEGFGIRLQKRWDKSGGATVEAAGKLVSPMPGLVTAVLVEPGQEVKQGQTLVIMEAMKMEHVIRATSEGVVKEIFCKAGEMVGGGVVLVEM